MREARERFAEDVATREALGERQFTLRPTAQYGGVLLVLEGHQSPVRAVAFSPDGRLASAGDDGTVRLWDPVAGHLTATLAGHTGSVRAVAFSPDGRLASAGDDGTVRLWDPVVGQLNTSLQGYTGPVLGVAFSPDGRRFVGAGDDSTVRLWDVAQT